ncbi:hypothetical protein [Cochlodiniinecator piscidefendens]|uniref:hypothetical protein n=1 Tax=Cochlodiniinecator piscidefendens TaxID=2715756 RepID=UPI00140A2A1B|nr:hypothetical protein [Cochlodiniinecator piscidefendens]
MENTMNAEVYTHQNRGRAARTVAVLGAIYAISVFAFVWLNAAWWIIAALVVFTLPAIWDLATDRVAGLTLSDTQITWRSGSFEDYRAYGEIEKVRFDTRLDFSVRVTLVLSRDRKLRLPYDCLPPHKEFEDELNKRNIKTERHHFSLM